jgi:hypothetical protein
VAKIIKLGAGRFFAPAEQTTARQDGWITVQAADAGITRFIGRTLDEHTAVDLVIQVLRSGKREHILAGVLVEQDVKWTPETAEQNAEFFAEITDPEAKAALADAFIPALAGFFLSGAESSTDSPSASTATTPAPRSARTPRKSATRSTKRAAPAAAAPGAESPAS